MALVQYLFGRWLSAWWRYALGMLIVLRLVIPFTPPADFSVFNLFERSSESRPGQMPDPVILETRSLPETIQPAALSLPGQIPPRRAVPWLALFWLSIVLSLVGLPLCQHFRLSISLRRSGRRIDDLELLEVFRQAKEIVGVSRGVKILTSSTLSVPAVFGLWRPALLVPEALLKTLDRDEWRLVFLHELAHIKRHDVLLNWLMIVARALHWFNPLVWWAVKRLRADRELVCDAIVLQHLNPERRQLYGQTLIKLLEDVPKIRLCPSLSSILSHKHHMRRRITMIAQSKKNTRAAAALSCVLLITLCGLTFTRAAEKTGQTSGDPTSQSPQRESASPEPSTQARGAIEALRKQLDERNEEVARAQAVVAERRRLLEVPAYVSEGISLASFFPTETIRQLEAALISAKNSQRAAESLLSELAKLDPRDLKEALPTAHPDPALNALMIERLKAEQKLIGLRQDFTEDHKDVRRTAAVLKAIETQFDNRVKGVMGGLRISVTAGEKQMETLAAELNLAKANAAELAGKYRPYFDAKKDLETRIRIRDALQMRIAQEEVELALPKSRQAAPAP